MSEHPLLRVADNVRDASERRLQIQLEVLANRRLAEVRREFRKRYPKRRLSMIFGNGTELIEIDGRQFYTPSRTDPPGYFQLVHPRGLNATSSRLRHVRALGFITEGIVDVRWICGYYGDACPSDVVCRPSKRRAR